MDKQVFSFLGKPNSGKGTLISDLLDFYKDKHNIDVVSGSKIIRQVDPASALGREIENSIAHGEYIKPEITVELLRKAIRENRSDIVCIDGAMQQIEVGRAFDSSSDMPIDALIALIASDELCIERSKKRIVCNICRSSYQIGQELGKGKSTFIADVGGHCIKCSGVLQKRADENIIQKRLAEFNKNALPVIEHYNNDSTKSLNINILQHTTRQEVQKQTTDFLSESFNL